MPVTLDIKMSGLLTLSRAIDFSFPIHRQKPKWGNPEKIYKNIVVAKATQRKITTGFAEEEKRKKAPLLLALS